MRVLQVSDGLAAEFGGTAAACAQLSTCLARSGVDVSLLACEARDNSPRWTLDPAVTETFCPPAPPRRLGFCPALPTIVASLPRPQLVHVHGLWRLHYLQAARCARRLGAPVVVSVHGMLYELALGQKRALKRAARWAYQDRLLRSARCLHATSSEEAQHIRRLGFDGPIAIVPWGVDAADQDATASDNPSPQSRRTILYFGRIHPHKGLDVLLRAWARVHDRFHGWRLVIAGPEQNGCRPGLVALASELGVTGSISWAGPAAGAERERLFADAGLVVLPSLSENFGLVIAEALARGLPAIAMHGAPWQVLRAERCGWWIPAGVDSLAEALDDAIGRTDADRRAMGDRGRALARARFSWDVAGAAMRRLYSWVIGAESEPDFIC